MADVTEQETSPLGPQSAHSQSAKPIAAEVRAANRDHDPIAVAAFVLSIVVLLVTGYFSWQTLNIMSKQTSIELIAGFATEEITTATKALVNAEMSKTDYTNKLGDFEAEIASLKSQLYAVAACLDAQLCDETITSAAFCVRAVAFKKMYVDIYKRAGEEATLPPYYANASKECAPG